MNDKSSGLIKTISGLPGAVTGLFGTTQSIDTPSNNITTLKD